jgi:uncharacterized membrane-anchored protein
VNPPLRLGTDSAFGMLVTVVVLLGVLVAVVLFERRRAEQIESDIDEDARRRGRRGKG